MIEKKHLEELLKANGLDATSSEEDIRFVLAGAKLNETEICDGLMLLKTETSPVELQDSGSHKLFRSGEALQPGEISQLLGVNVVVKEVIYSDYEPDKKAALFNFVVLWLTSVVLAAIVLTSYMYTQKIGIFHPAMEGMSLHM